jgi:hypothetical protein
MGMIICENHGKTGIKTGILEQICQKVLDDIPILQEELSYINVDYYDNKEFMFSNKYIVTKKFKKESNLNDYYKVTSEEEDEALYKRLGANIGVLCGKCFDEYLKKFNIDIDAER